VFRETGAANLAIQALALLDHVDRLWFHLDVDILDPTLMPVGIPEPDGLSFDETLTFLSTSIRSKMYQSILLNK
jgi:arginase family enzyme